MLTSPAAWPSKPSHAPRSRRLARSWWLVEPGLTARKRVARFLADQLFSELATSAERWWRVAWQHNPDDLRAALAGVVEIYRRHQAVLVALNEMAAYDPATAQTYRDLLTAITQPLTRVIEDGQTDGSVRSELPAATTASALTWMVERVCQQNLPAEPPGYDPELVATLAQIVWGTLYLKTAPAL